MKTITWLLLAVSFNSMAQIPSDVIEEINLRVKHNHNPSIVVGVYEDGEFSYHVAGWQNVVEKNPATTKTVYEIGSISKTFTGLILAKMANEKKLSLDDAVQDYWTKPFKFVDSENQAITFKHLTTHTSGLPRLPSNLNPNAKDPYADYDRLDLIEAIKLDEPGKAGINFLYSNFAVGLLGESLAVIENSTYPELIENNLLKPMGLKQTHMLIDQVPKAHLAYGYNLGMEVEAWRFKSLAGAGAIRSSIEDLIKYGVAHLESSDLQHENSQLKSAIKLATTPHFNKGNRTVGLGWLIKKGGIIYHDGATAGFNSLIMIDPKQNKVVAGITNSNFNASIQDIVAHMMDESKPMKDHEFPVEISAKQLNQFTGNYFNSKADQSTTIVKKGNELFFTAPKQPRKRLTYIGDDTFKISFFDVKIKFLRDENQQITKLDLDGWGATQQYNKVEQKTQ